VLRVLKHVGDAIKEFLTVRRREEEKSAEIYDLHIDHDTEALVPGWRFTPNTDEGVHKFGILSSGMWNVGKVAENVISKRLELWIFFDVHHMEQLFHKYMREELKKLSTFVRREGRVKPKKNGFASRCIRRWSLLARSSFTAPCF
jgi:hypothetical protein